MVANREGAFFGAEASVPINDATLSTRVVEKISVI
jgi:hypothetical protein